MQLTWGVLVGHEPMPPARWVGFALIWLALAVFSADALRRAGARKSVGRRVRTCPIVTEVTMAESEHRLAGRLALCRHQRDVILNGSRRGGAGRT